MKPGGVTFVDFPGQIIWREPMQAICTRCGEPITSTNHRCPDGTVFNVPRDPLLVEREKTHGSFEDNAIYSQEIKHVFEMAQRKRPLEMNPVHREVLDMIAHKLSRLLQHPEVKDHWDDIAGYAHLGAEACPKTD